MAEPYMGEISLLPYNFAPRGWAYCQGQLLQIAQYQALYSIIGTTYGGDGRTTFQLPDLRARTAIGAGQGPGLSMRSLGWAGGSETVTLSPPTLPAHLHAATAEITEVQVKASTTQATEAAPASGSVLAAGYDDRFTQAVYEYRKTPTQTVQLGGTGLAPGTPVIENTGGGQPHTNRMPSLGVNYCIALDGEYPPRP